MVCLGPEARPEDLAWVSYRSQFFGHTCFNTSAELINDMYQAEVVARVFGPKASIEHIYRRTRNTMKVEISRATCINRYEAQLQLQTALHFGCHVVQDSQHWRETTAETLASIVALIAHAESRARIQRQSKVQATWSEAPERVARVRQLVASGVGKYIAKESTS